MDEQPRESGESHTGQLAGQRYDLCPQLLFIICWMPLIPL
jgi:hypothetical protein